jgi:hypothetical protein
MNDTDVKEVLQIKKPNIKEKLMNLKDKSTKPDK